MVEPNLLKQCGKQTMFVGNFWHAKHVEIEILRLVPFSAFIPAGKANIEQYDEVHRKFHSK